MTHSEITEDSRIFVDRKEKERNTKMSSIKVSSVNNWQRKKWSSVKRVDWFLEESLNDKARVSRSTNKVSIR